MLQPLLSLYVDMNYLFLQSRKADTEFRIIFLEVFIVILFNVFDPHCGYFMTLGNVFNMQVQR